jgi:cell division protein FtsL
MAVLTRTPKFEVSPIRAARMRRRRFPWYFEMDSATLFMAGVTLLALTSLLYLLQTSRVSVLGYEIQQTQLQQTEAGRLTENLRYEIQKRESLPAVEEYARTKLKMRPVSEYEYVRVPVKPGELRGAQRSLGEPERPRPESSISTSGTSPALIERRAR